MLIPTAEPFFFPGHPPKGSIGCLLIHGFTGAPKEMRWMGEDLNRRGYTVLGVRLAGHATRAQDMARVRWQDWVASVEDGYHLLRGAVDQVFLAGLSMGGVLSLYLAARLPVAGLMTMATPYALPQDWRIKHLGWLHRIQPTYHPGPPDWHNLQAEQDHIHYKSYPSRGIVELRDLLAEMRASLPQVHVPALLVHSHQDQAVHPENMEHIYQHIGSADKQMLWVNDSGHVIPREPERQRVFQAADDFFSRVAGGIA
ncbi:MAG: alpha/beta fold hydrolase [Anaerolineales bacterium]|nr:alpha/beta fold hydrolase [Anaerolineales bacterium]